MWEIEKRWLWPIKEKETVTLNNEEIHTSIQMKNLSTFPANLLLTHCTCHMPSPSPSGVQDSEFLILSLAGVKSETDFWGEGEYFWDIVVWLQFHMEWQNRGSKLDSNYSYIGIINIISFLHLPLLLSPVKSVSVRLRLAQIRARGHKRVSLHSLHIDKLKILPWTWWKLSDMVIMLPLVAIL